MPQKEEAVSKRCPKCHKVTCAFDIDKTSIICSSCGFEERLQI